MARLRVLVHNPQPRFLMATLSALAETGLEVSGSASEAEALARFQSGGYDILLLPLPARGDAESPWMLLLLRPDPQTVLAVPTPFPRPLFAVGVRADTLRKVLAEARAVRDSAEASALAPLLEASERIAAKVAPEEMVKAVVEGISKLTSATVWLFTSSRDGLVPRLSSADSGSPPPVAVRLSRWVETEKRPLLILEPAPSATEWTAELAQASLSSAIVLPLKRAEAVSGVMCVLRRGAAFTSYDVQLVSIFLPLIALALEHQQVGQQHQTAQSSLSGLQEQMERRQQEIRALNAFLLSHQSKLVELEEAYRQMKVRYLTALRSLVNFLEGGDPSQGGSSERAALLMVSLAESLAVPTEGLAEAAYLHDLGLALPKEAGGAGNAAEQLLKHPQVAAQLAQALGLPKELSLAVAHHHEKYDGSGYPDGLAGDRIPLAARLLHIVDAYTEMVSPPPPGRPLPPAEALAKLKADAGREYDPRLVTALAKLVEGIGKPDTEMLSTVSHELRSPLSFLVGYSELLADQQDLPAGARERATEIHQEALHMSEMVDDLLNVSRYEAGRVELRRQEVDLGQLVQRSVTKARSKATRHQVEVSLPPAPLKVNVDPDKTLQVLDNLLDNAIKYSPEGGIITITAEKRPGEIVVSVSDQGIGIPREKQGMLFQKFYRVDSPLKAQVEGTGLGLNLCQHIVQAHGGRIWVESEAGRGSTFSFTLPLGS